MDEIIEMLYKKQYELCATHPRDDPEGFIYRLSKINAAIMSIKKLNF